jgi:hypothetical protein
MKLATHLALAIFMVATLPARADDGIDAEARRVASRFVQLAGSEDNALALVLALRHGSPVQLVQPDDDATTLPETVCVETPTAPMAWNDVRIALLHAQDMLLRAGLTRPPPAAVQAALLGGEIVASDGHRVMLRGVLQMRVDGLTWVDIARVTAPETPAR